MTATILIDNHSTGSLASEWGLAIYLSFRGHTLLLDTGASHLFAENADALGLRLEDVECGILSHAHYDHADGMDTFFARNPTAPFYLQVSCKENCYNKKGDTYEYDGIKPGLLTQYSHRIRYVEGKVTIFPMVDLLPHKTPGLSSVGVKSNMYRLEGNTWIPDDFSHEQSLVFHTDNGLVLFNSCCHAGADTILREAADTFPGQPLQAIVGGFHLFETSDEEVDAFAHRLAATGVRQVVTGHCTGDRALTILQKVLGSRVLAMESGMTLTF